MKRTKKFTGILVVFLLSLFLLSACSDDEWDLIAEFFVVWAEQNSIVIDGAFQTDQAINTVVNDKISDVTNSEKSIQLDGLDVIRDIEQADAIADQAMDDLDPDQMVSALSIRPSDWRLHEKDGVIWVANDNLSAATSAFRRSDDLLRESLESGGDCLSLRRNQLEARSRELWEATLVYESQPGRSQGDAKSLRQVHGKVGRELNEINTYKTTPFCDS